MNAKSKSLTLGLAACTFLISGLTGCSTFIANWSNEYNYDAVKTDTGWRVVPNKEKRFKELQDDAFKVIMETNRQRAKRRLPPLRYDPDLAAFAFVRAKEIAHKPSHERPDGSEFSDAFTGGLVAESFKENFGGNPAKAWLKDKDAEDKILSENFTRIGVGHYRKSLKDFFKFKNNFWVQILADDTTRLRYYFESRYADYKPAFFSRHEREMGIGSERDGKSSSKLRLFERGPSPATLRELGDTELRVVKDAARPDQYRVIMPDDEVNALGQTISDLVSQTNKIRRGEGIGALSPVESLNAYALARSAEMTRGHVDSRPDGSDGASGVRGAERAAENALVTRSPHASDAVKAWIRGDATRANVLDKNFKVFGAGVSKKDGKYYWSGIFATEGGRSDYDVEVVERPSIFP